MPNFDRRTGRGSGPAELAEAAAGRAALADLHRRDPAVKVQLDPVLRTPALISRAHGFLSDGSPRAAIGLAGVPGLADDDPAKPIRRYLEMNKGLFGGGSELLDGARVVADYVTVHNGLRTVIWQQELDGIAVYAGLFTGHVTRRGDLVSLSSRFVPEAAAAAERDAGDRRRLAAGPPVDAGAAVVLAAANLGLTLADGDLAAPDEGSVGPEKRQYFGAAALKGRARARLVWFPMNRTKLRLCWEIQLASRLQGQLYRILVDAQTGDALLRRCLTFDAAEMTYRVFDSDSPTPFSPGHRTPSREQPAGGERVLVTLAALSTNASPNGWIDAGVDELRGNNVDARLDRNGDDQADLPRTRAAAGRSFDFPLDLNRAPSSYGDAAVTQLFYWCNWAHDRLYELGFTEAAGNFQRQNFNRGGVGGDWVEAEAQDGGGYNNANFTAPEDGEPGRLQIYIFDGPNPDRDGAFDAELVLHEYAHGLTARLVGGGFGLMTLQGGGLAEGWSDFYALALLSESGDDLDGNYAMGAYASYGLENGTDNYYYGIRRYPYSTDLRRNPLTLKDIDPTQADAHAEVPLSPLFRSSNTADEVHRMGEVWCAALWEARANLIRKWGFETGNQLMLQLVTDSLKLMPPEPTYLDARDAVLQADLVKSGGEDREELWQGFAKRGFGFSARCPASGTSVGVVEAFDVPDDLRVEPIGAWVANGPEAGPFRPSEQVYTLSNAGTNGVEWAALKNAAWLDLSQTSGSLEKGAGPIRVVARLNPAVHGLPAGIYRDEITFTNRITARSQTRAVVLRIGQADSFTQMFDETEDHLGFQTLTFTPDGSSSFYSVCRQPATDFPTDPALGTALVLDDEGSEKLELTGDAQVQLYGRTYGALWVAANGYITFAGSVSEFSESFAAHFAAPRISMLFDDLDPGEDGLVTWAQLDDRVAVTFENVPNFWELNRNSFQAELFFDGRIRLTYLGVDALSGLVGLSAGGGEPPGFVPSGLLTYGPCLPALAVEVPGNVVESAGALTGQVRVPVALEKDLEIVLTSLAPETASVPERVVLPAGAASVSFTIQLRDNVQVDGTKVMRLLARAAGFQEGSGRLQVQDDERATLGLTIPATAREGDGVLRQVGAVTLRPSPSQSVVVRLFSADGAEVEPSAAVVFGPGQGTAAFDLHVKDDGRIDGPRAVRIWAHVENWTDGAGQMTVLDNEGTDLVLEMRSNLGEGSGTLPGAGRVTIPGTLDRALTVTLDSSQPGRVQVPASVTVPAGATNASFDIKLLDDLLIQGSEQIHFTARAAGFSNGSISSWLHDNEKPPVPVAPHPAHLSSNTPPSVVLSWATGGGEALANGGFETGDFEGWVLENSGDGSFVLNDGLLDPTGPDGLSTPGTGQFSAVSQQSGPGQYVLYQDVFIPPGSLSAVLTWRDRIRNHAGGFLEPEQGFRVEIRSAENQLLTRAFTTRVGDVLLQEWTRRDYDLSDFIGQTVRVAFVQEARVGYFNVHLDDLSVSVRAAQATTFDVYFGENPMLQTGDKLGTTGANRWELGRLDLARTYYWRVIAKLGAAETASPVWQFSVPGVGPLHHFAWSPLPAEQYAGVPFEVKVAALDAFDNPVTNFSGTVTLSAERVFPELQTGAGTNRWEFPLGAAFGDSRTQVLYLPEEVGPARRLTSLALFAATPRTTPLNRFRIRMKHTSLRSYPERPAWERTGWTTVYQREQPINARGWITFHFSTPFEYDGVRGLMVDFTALESGFSSGGVCQASDTEDGRAIWYESFGWDGDPLTWTGSDSPVPILSYQVPDVRFTAANVLELSPAVSGRFGGGVWTGTLAVLGPGPGIVLRAEDGDGHTGSGNPITVAARNDLELTVTASPEPVTVEQTLEYIFRISHSGPEPAAGVVLSNSWPAGFQILSHRASQGEVTVSDGTVRGELGTIPGGGSATVTLQLQAPSAPMVVTNTATVTRAEADAYRPNNSAVVLTTVVPVPSLSVQDVTVSEGDEASTDASFSVRLSGRSSQRVTVQYATANGNAVADEDFVPISGTLEFPPGVVSRSVIVQVKGDRSDERDENFILNLSAAVNATLAARVGVGKIEDDDGPQLTIADATVIEGSRGTTNCVFRLSLDAPSPQTISVDYMTVSSTAKEGADFESKYDTVSFSPGSTNRTVAIPVRGDLAVEPDERFYVSLFLPENATLLRKQAVGQILNDDGLPGEADHFVWDTIASPQVVNRPFPVKVLALDAFEKPATNFMGAAKISGEMRRPDTEVGTGKTAWAEPMGVYFEDSRVQMIYLATELGGPRRITGLALSVQKTPALTLNRWTIRLKHTPLSAYSESAGWESTGWTTVYQANETVSTTGWTAFSFQTPFEYSGEANLMVDLSFNNNEYSFEEGECLATETESFRTLWSAADSDMGDPLTWSGQMAWPEPQDRVLNLRLLSRFAVPVAPSTPVEFAAGAWTGEVTVQAMAEGMILRAEDEEGHYGDASPISTTLVDDVSLSVVATPSPVTVGYPVTYELTVYNSGPSPATGLVLSNRFANGLTIRAVEASQGTRQPSAAAIIYNLGTLEGGMHATVRFVAENSVMIGVLTNVATVTRAGADSYLENNAVVTLIPVYREPTIIAHDLTAAEGSAGEAAFTFAVTLSEPSSETVAVDYATVDGTATAGLDYTSSSGAVTFPPGIRSQNVTVPVLGDLLDETEETFFIEFSNPRNGTLQRQRARGRIIDDDGPAISVAHASKLEGDLGPHNLPFSVRLSAASPQTILVAYETTDETATSGADYQAASGVITFAPGTTLRTVGIQLHGDIDVEPDETVAFRLLTPTNATIQTSSVLGTILNDDGLPGNLAHFEWAPLPVQAYVGHPFTVTIRAKDILGQTAINFTGTADLEARLPWPETSVGNGSLGWAPPLDTAYQLARVQAIYLASEVGAARRITELALNVTKLPPNPVRNWTIRMKHTSRSEFSATAWESTGWTAVYSADEHFETTGWHSFRLERPFDFNGTNHLLVDFSFRNTESFFRSGACAASETLQARCLAAGDFAFSDDENALTWSGRFPEAEILSQVPDLQIRSIKRLRLNPVRSAEFSAGQWTGAVALEEPATNLVLRATSAFGHAGSGNELTVHPWNDLDRDGLPDDWELGHQLDPAKREDAASDLDQDGLSGLDEYRLGTDPADPASGLILGLVGYGRFGFELFFPTVVGKVYQIESSSDLSTGIWFGFGQPVTGTGEMMVVPFPASDHDWRCYRIRVLP